MEIVEKKGTSCRRLPQTKILENGTGGRACVFQNRRLGCIKFGVSFRGTLQGFVAQIKYSHPRKVPRKDTSDLLFRFPKSSFGMHNFMPPKRRFWKPKQRVGRVCSRHFARVSTRFGQRPSQNASKRHALLAVSVSKIVVWEAYN